MYFLKSCIVGMLAGLQMNDPSIDSISTLMKVSLLRRACFLYSSMRRYSLSCIVFSFFFHQVLVLLPVVTRRYLTSAFEGTGLP